MDKDEVLFVGATICCCDNPDKIWAPVTLGKQYNVGSPKYNAKMAEETEKRMLSAACMATAFNKDLSHHCAMVGRLASVWVIDGDGVTRLHYTSTQAGVASAAELLLRWMKEEFGEQFSYSLRRADISPKCLFIGFGIKSVLRIAAVEILGNNQQLLREKRIAVPIRLWHNPVGVYDPAEVLLTPNDKRNLNVASLCHFFGVEVPSEEMFMTDASAGARGQIASNKQPNGNTGPGMKRQKLVAPLKWHGGKHYLAKRIVAMMPCHLHYVEPYFGGGAVLLARDPDSDALQLSSDSSHKGVSEVVNDINGVLMNFWNVLADEKLFRKFQRIVTAIPFSQTAWRQAAETMRNGYTGYAKLDVDDAVAFFIWCRQSLAGRMNAFAAITKNRTRRSMNEQASAWLNCVDNLDAVATRMRRVVVLSDEALRVIVANDTPHTLFYCDPPYVPQTRAADNVYAYEMSYEQHRDLLQVLGDIKGMFILSGYPHKLYDDYAKRHNWRHCDFTLPNNAAAGKSKRRMKERLWLNYAI